jgi:hypothetical protein
MKNIREIAINCAEGYKSMFKNWLEGRPKEINTRKEVELELVFME